MSVVSASELSGKVQAAFNFSVEKFPLSGPDGMKTPWYGLFRSDSGDVVGTGSVTGRYVPHQTEDIVALVDAASQVFDGQINVRCHFRHGHYVSIEPTADHRRNIFGTADAIFPRVVVSAGYDGKSFRASMGLYRDVCRNLHIPRMVKGTGVNIRHTSGLRTKMDYLVATFYAVRDSWESLTDWASQLESIVVSMPEFLRSVYGEPNESKRGGTVHKKRVEAIMLRLNRELAQTGRPAMGSDSRVSAWMALNAVQGYVQHDAQAKKGFKSEFDRILRAASDNAVLKAESFVSSLIA